MTKKKLLQIVFFVTIVTFYIILVMYGDKFLPEKYFWDSEMLMNISSGDKSVDNKGSYYYTAIIFSLIGNGVWLFNFVVGLLFILYVSMYCVNYSTIAISVILIMPHIILGLSRPQKETLVSLLTLLCVYIISKMKYKHAVASVFLLYMSYAIIRNYFFLIGLIFIFLYFVEYIKEHRYKVSIYISLFVFAMFIPSDLFIKLQGTRDAFNILRPVGQPGHETVLFNPYSPDNVVFFVFNYIYSIVYFNVPILFFRSFNTLYLQVFVIIYISVIFALKRFRNKRDYIYVNLFTSHLIVYLLFEPDLGSYMRHVSSISIYIIPLIKNHHDSSSKYI
jgi:hypothetical protein